MLFLLVFAEMQVSVTNVITLKVRYITLSPCINGSPKRTILKLNKNLSNLSVEVKSTWPENPL